LDDNFDLTELQDLVVHHLASCIRKVLQKFTDLEKELGVDLNGESKRFLGHLIAEVLKKEAGFDRAEGADFYYKGRPIEIKHTIADNWMIAQENIGRGSILIKTNLIAEKFSVGYLDLTLDNLNAGRNRDTKVSVSAAGKLKIVWWLVNEAY
jgi:hypothetical protein